jgi:hypothetical protein
VIRVNLQERLCSLSGGMLSKLLQKHFPEVQLEVPDEAALVPGVYVLGCAYYFRRKREAGGDGGATASVAGPSVTVKKDTDGAAPPPPPPRPTSSNGDLRFA